MSDFMWLALWFGTMAYLCIMWIDIGQRFTKLEKMEREYLKDKYHG